MIGTMKGPRRDFSCWHGFSDHQRGQVTVQTWRFIMNPSRLEIPVGTALAGGPPDRSQRAELLHWAPALGRGGEAHVGVGMHDAGER
jgi:hypothetical protein